MSRKYDVSYTHVDGWFVSNFVVNSVFKLGCNGLDVNLMENAKNL